MLCTFTSLASRLLLVSVGAGLIPPAVAQVHTDGSFGPARNLSGPTFTIGVDLGKQVGPNLFQSFTTFNVGQGETARFTGPSSVGNVIARVTGGSASAVNGQIASTIPGANLFLLNPSGWVFGSHATLSVQGSVHVSTADNLAFADGTRLPTGTAIPSGGSSFTSAPPEAFGFLGSQSGAINIAGSRLATPVGKDLSIVAGSVRIEGGHIKAPAGQLRIASAAGAGEINLNGSDPGHQVAPAHGPVTLTGRTVVDVGDAAGGQGGGAIQVRGGNVLIDDSVIRARNDSGQPGGTVTVKADTLTLQSRGRIVTSARASGDAGAISVETTGPINIYGDGTTRLTGIRSMTRPATSGRAGRVSVTSGGALNVIKGGYVGNQTLGTGGTNPVRVTAPTMTLDALGSSAPSRISSEGEAGSSGVPGPVTVQANNISLHAEGQIASFGSGAAGSGAVDVRATGAIDIDGLGNLAHATGILSEVEGGSHGDAGGVALEANSLRLANQGLISSSTFGAGNAGQVRVTGIGANSSLTIDGGSLTTETGVVSNAEARSGGAAGPVTVSMDSIKLLNTGQISSSTFSAGNAGPVTVNANTLSADGGGRTDFDTGIFSNADKGSTGNAGPVNVAANAIDLHAQGVISSSTFAGGNAGPVTVNTSTLCADGGGHTNFDTGIDSIANQGSGGNAGPVTVAANTIDLSNHAVISSSTFGAGNAGQVRVTGIGANSSLTIDGGRLTTETGVVSNAEAGSGAAGPVTVSMGSIQLLNTGQISSSTFSGGNAGPVTVNANTLSADGGGRTDFDTGIFSNADKDSTGNAGPVTVTANAIDLHAQGVISSSTFGPGQGGSVTVRTGQLSALGSPGPNVFDTGISTNADGGTGFAGDIQVFADSINLQTNGRISSSSFTSARGGDVTIAGNMQPLELMISGPGAGVSARATSSDGSGAGTIAIDARTISVMDQGEITTSAEAGGGGRIDLAVWPLIWLDRGSITTSVHGGTGDSGDLTATSRFVVLNHSQILADADAGRGGNITITAQTYFASPDSLVQASAARGINGIITIEAPQSDVAGTLAELPGNLLHPPTLQQRGCSAVAESQGLSSFAVSASDGLPRNGDGPQAAPYFELQQGSAAFPESQATPARVAYWTAMLDSRPTCWH